MKCYTRRVRKRKEQISYERSQEEYQRKLDAMTEEERIKYLKDREERLKKLTNDSAIIRAIINRLYDTPYL